MAVATSTLVIGSLLLAGGTAKTVSALKQGKDEASIAKNQGEVNAMIFEQQARMVAEQKKISDYQNRRKIAKMRGAVTAAAAGKGILLSGSPAAIMVDNESNLRFDAAIEQYNLDVRKNYYLSRKNESTYMGQSGAYLAKKRAKAKAWSSILNTGTNIAFLGSGKGFYNA